MRKKKKKNKQEGYKFSDKTHPVFGIVSVILGSAALMGLLALFVQSGLRGGKGSLIYGAMGLLLMLAAVAGLFLACASFRKREIHYTFPIAGLILNGILSLTYLVVYLVGIFTI